MKNKHDVISPSEISDLKHKKNPTDADYITQDVETITTFSDQTAAETFKDSSYVKPTKVKRHRKELNPKEDEFAIAREAIKGTPEDNVIVKMRDVRVAFKIGSLERVIINHLNLDIKRGEILGLVGESGSGKTTIGRAIIRINNVSGGEILYNGVKISGKISKKRERLLKTKIQMIFQDPGDSLNDRANIDYIVSEGLRAFHLYKDDQDRVNKVVEMMEKVGLRPEYLSRYPHEFSGGQRQRIGIARAIIMNPELIIADEPVSALDVSIQAQVINLLNDLRNNLGLTILFIAHNLSVVKYFCDRIAVMYYGSLMEITTSEELFKNPLHPYTKSLLSAVPRPDPNIEQGRVRIAYNPMTDHDYSKQAPSLREIVPGHFVRCNDEEEARYLKELKGE